jgi:hypothetical protein
MTALLISLLLAMSAAALLYWSFVRPWHLSWGATDEELKRLLPGDELAPARPRLNATRALTINAPAADVWPWLVQIGQNRGGFYSYTLLENLVGCHMSNADRINPEWQSLNAGDSIWLHPKAPPVKVLSVDAGKSIVLERTWAFVLLPIGEQKTRLIIRGQGNYNPDLGNTFLNFLLWRVLFEPVHFIMERKMMLGIKRRAEGFEEELWRSQAASSGTGAL